MTNNDQLTIEEYILQCVKAQSKVTEEVERMRTLVNDINLVLQSSHTGQIDLPRSLVLLLHNHKLMSDASCTILLKACKASQDLEMKNIMPDHRTTQ